MVAVVPKSCLCARLQIRSIKLIFKQVELNGQTCNMLEALHCLIFIAIWEIENVFKYLFQSLAHSMEPIIGINLAQLFLFMSTSERTFTFIEIRQTATTFCSIFNCGIEILFCFENCFLFNFFWLLFCYQNFVCLFFYICFHFCVTSHDTHLGSCSAKRNTIELLAPCQILALFI